MAPAHREGLIVSARDEASLTCQGFMTVRYRLVPESPSPGGPDDAHHRAPAGTVRRAHRLEVVDRGRIVEERTHTALLARGGVYARL